MRRSLIIAALCLTGLVAAGCGDEAPKEGDNPAANNGRAASELQNYRKRGTPMGAGQARQQSAGAASMPASRKGQ